MDEVSLVPFRYKYLPFLLEMLESREYLGISEINMKTLPKIGYMALLNNKPVAAGFLRRVEGGYAQLDGLTSNPYLGSIVRHKGIELVVDHLISAARQLKLNGVIGFTSDKGVLKRAEGLGFTTVDQSLIALRLKE